MNSLPGREQLSRHCSTLSGSDAPGFLTQGSIRSAHSTLGFIGLSPLATEHATVKFHYFPTYRKADSIRKRHTQLLQLHRIALINLIDPGTIDVVVEDVPLLGNETGFADLVAEISL